MNQQMKSLTAALLACFFATMVPSEAASTLTKAKAGTVITASLKQDSNIAQRCFPIRVNSISQKGDWAFVSASCHTSPEPLTNAILHQARGSWIFACGHGDDVMYADKAMKRCGMTHAQALSFGFPDARH